MTTEKAIEFGKIFLKTIEDEKGSATYEFVETAIKALEEQSTLDKIRAEIQSLRNCSCSCSDGIIDDVEDIIDKYRAESEE